MVPFKFACVHKNQPLLLPPNIEISHRKKVYRSNKEPAMLRGTPQRGQFIVVSTIARARVSGAPPPHPLRLTKWPPPQQIVISLRRKSVPWSHPSLLPWLTTQHSNYDYAYRHGFSRQNTRCLFLTALALLATSLAIPMVMCSLGSGCVSTILRPIPTLLVNMQSVISPLYLAMIAV